MLENAGMKSTRGWLRLVLLVLAAAAAAVLAGCYKAPEDRSKAQLRLINASDGYAALDLSVDGSVKQAGVPYGGTSTYAEVDPDRTTSLINATGSATALVSFTPTLARNSHYAALAFGRAGSLRELTLDENQSAPSSGRTKLRIINAAPDAGSLDVYFTAATEDIRAAVPLRAGATYGDLSAPQEAVSGTWRLRVTAANSKDDVRLDLSNVVLTGGEAAVLVLAPTMGGTLVNALYVVQRGGIGVLTGTQARARVVAGVLQSGVVSVSVGGATLMNQVPSPALQPYNLVTAGAPVINISVNSASVGAPVTSLAVGSDNTLLVLGPASTPQAVWVNDPNPQPAAAGKALLRLVNATTGVATSLSLKLGLSVAASGVAAGAASDYTAVDAAAKASLLVQDSVPNTLFSGTDLELLTGVKYSLFVIGTPGAGTLQGTLVRDR
jgi:hypothetical protein